MKAVVIPAADRSTPELALVPVPQHGADELLVQIKAIGVGIHDSYFLPQGFATPFPIGIEAAGIIVQIGSELTHRYRPGDRIAFVSTDQLKGGTWAEYAALRGDSLILPVPDGLDFERAAAVPVAANTALRALHAIDSMPDTGGSIFIAGASGAIGTLAVQLALAKGWQVAGSASRHNHDYLRSLGVSSIVDYHDETWPEHIRRWRPDGVDAAIAVNPDTTADCLPVVRTGGTVVTVSGDQTSSTPTVGVTGLDYQVDVTAELMTFLDQVADGRVHLEIEHVYPFDEALDALAKVQTRHARGKVVLTLAG